jgi:hypothetical protein
MLAMVLCLALPPFAAAIPLPQDEPPKPESTETKKTVEKKTNISVHFTVEAEGKSSLPTGSKIDLKGDARACKNLKRLQQHLGSDGATFPDVPVCKVRLWIYITGFETKTLSLDLAHYKGPARILVKSKGPPAVDW